jgi:hypothetical protein
MRVTLCAKCKNQSCQSTVIVSEGSEVSSQVKGLWAADLEWLLDVEHDAVCSSCGLKQVFRERELMALAS